MWHKLADVRGRYSATSAMGATSATSQAPHARVGGLGRLTRGEVFEVASERVAGLRLRAGWRAAARYLGGGGGKSRSGEALANGRLPRSGEEPATELVEEAGRVRRAGDMVGGGGVCRRRAAAEPGGGGGESCLGEELATSRVRRV